MKNGGRGRLIFITSDNSGVYAAHNTFATMDIQKIETVRKALESGNVDSVEFSKDGSGVAFHYTDSTGDHGLPCTMFTSFPIKEALQILCGFRFRQHENKTCY